MGTHVIYNNYMRHILLLLLLISLSLKGFAQQSTEADKITRNGHFAVLAGYTYNNQSMIEAGVVRGWRQRIDNPEMPGQQFIMPYSYAALSTEVLLSNHNTIIGPKLGYHYTFMGLHVGASVFNYTDFSRNQFGVRPEAGLSLGGLISVTYGYNLSSNNDTFGLSHHNVGIKFIFGSHISE